MAAEAGANFIGLVLIPGLRRSLNIEAARNIVVGLKHSFETPPQVVGLFANQNLEDIHHTIQACDLDITQFCGDETPDYCNNVDSKVIKVLRVAANTPVNATVAGLDTQIRLFQEVGCLITLDRQVKGLKGGTGRSFNWSIAAALSSRSHSFLLAGGLSPENVADAVSIAQPWGVDVSSGVETEGNKDPDKTRAFIEQARRFKHSNSAMGGIE
jgi:phosphoribosylanthranilate isomerase